MSIKLKLYKTISIILTLCILLGIFSYSFSVFAIDDTEMDNNFIEKKELYTNQRLNDLIAGEDYVEDEIIVSSKVDTAEDVLEELTNSYGLSDKYCLSSCVGDSTSTSTSDDVTYVMSLEEGSATVPEIITDLEKNEDIIYAQPNFIYETAEEVDSYLSI